MKDYTVYYCQAGSSGNLMVKAESATDAKSIMESRGNSRYPYIVYKVQGPSGTVVYMEYGEASKIARQ